MTIDGKSMRLRQQDLVPESILTTPITVIGAGGIGSFTVVALAKCGFSDITVYDMDTIEEHNIPNQFYPLDAIGHPKVSALGVVVRNFAGVELKEKYEEYREQSLSKVVVMAVDTMLTRHSIYKQCIKRDSGVEWLVDGRMGGNQLEVYTSHMSRGDKKIYEKVMWSDAEAHDTPCTARATMYNVLNIASWITNQVRLVLSGKEYKRGLIFDLEYMRLVTPEYVEV